MRRNRSREILKMLEQDKVFEMEALIMLLSEIFNMSTTAVSKKLLEFDIRSLDDFLTEIESTSKRLKVRI